jgi:chloramphenicol 3-O phosphotransferase
MPVALQISGVAIAPGGEVIIGPAFRTLEAAWIAGVAAMARAGARVIVDEVFLGAATSQQRWRQALGGLRVLWVGVRCDSAVAAGREIARGDRVVGMAVAQADLVHRGVVYDLEVDTTQAESMACAGGRGSGGVTGLFVRSGNNRFGYRQGGRITWTSCPPPPLIRNLLAGSVGC